jgi:hypothetical protein
MKYVADDRDMYVPTHDADRRKLPLAIREDLRETLLFAGSPCPIRAPRLRAQKSFAEVVTSRVVLLVKKCWELSKGAEDLRDAEMPLGEMPLREMPLSQIK